MFEWLISGLISLMTAKAESGLLQVKTSAARTALSVSQSDFQHTKNVLRFLKIGVMDYCHRRSDHCAPSENDTVDIVYPEDISQHFGAYSAEILKNLSIIVIDKENIQNSTLVFNGKSYKLRSL